MTQCSLGTQRKTGTSDYVWLTNGLFLTFNALFLSGLGSLLLGVYVAELLNTDELCSSEPEVPDAPGAGTWLLALARNFDAMAEVSTYIHAAFKAWYWSQVCECIPEPPSTGEVCRVWTVPTLTPTYQRMKLPDLNFMGHILGTPPTSGTFYVETGQSVDMAFMVYPSGVEANQTLELQTGIGSHATSTQSLNPSYPYYGIQARSIGGGTYGPATIRFCYNGLEDPTPVYVPPPPEVPPEVPPVDTVSLCDSFEDVCAQINELRLEIEALFRALPPAPVSSGGMGWKYGTAHTSLTGHGSFDALGILGVLVECAIPSAWGRTAETPFRAIPNVAHVQFGVGGVPEDARQVRYSSETIWNPPAMVDSLFYNFAPGVTGTITPILPRLGSDG